MKLLAPMLLAVLAACSSPSPSESESVDPASVPAPSTSEPATGKAAVSGSGVVESVDIAAGTVTIAHGPIDALQWPAMTMPFKAPAVDLTSLRQGDRITFEIASRDGTHVITRIDKQ